MKIENEKDFKLVDIPEQEQEHQEQAANTWKGDKRYFQTGKKAGTLKPKYKFSENNNRSNFTDNEKETENDNEEKILNDLKAEAEKIKRESQTETEEIKPSVNAERKSIVSGGMLLILIDIFIPPMLVFIFNKHCKKNNIGYKDLKMDKEEMLELKPFADEVVQEFLADMRPMDVFLLMLLGVYGSKLVKTN